MSTTFRSTEQWRSFVGGRLDFRPADGVYRIAREMFTDTQLFELEMELIFEKSGSTPVTKARSPNPTTSSPCRPAASR